MRAEWGRLAAGGASKLWTGGFVMLAGLPPRSPQWALSRRKKREVERERDKSAGMSVAACFYEGSEICECRFGFLKIGGKRRKQLNVIFL